MLSYAKVKGATSGLVGYHTAPLVLNQAELDQATLTLFDYVTHGISVDVGFDYVMLDETELNFD